MAIRAKDRVEANVRQSDKVNNTLSIQLNSGTATVYDGSAAKSINITSAAINAINASLQSLDNYTGSSYYFTKYIPLKDTTENVAYYSDGLKINGQHYYKAEGSSSWSPAYVRLTLGKSGSNSSADNGYAGELCLYGDSSYYAKIVCSSQVTQNTTYYLPSAGSHYGRILVSPGASAFGNTTTPIYVAQWGVLTKCSSFVPTTGGSFTGRVSCLNANSAATAFAVARGGSPDVEGLRIHVYDSTCTFDYINDEVSSSFIFLMTNTDTESGGGASANNARVTFACASGKSTVTANTFSGALSGNATTATTLQTARTINGTSFNGSANITTANWGTARTITIGSTGKSVNGSAAVSWTLAEIGAAASSHTHSYLPLSGGTMTGQIKKAATGSSWIKGRDNAAFRMTSISGYSPTFSIKTNNGSWEIGAYDNSSYTDDLLFSYCTDTNYTANANTTTAQIRIYESGVISGAMWNDYAECRQCTTPQTPGGFVVKECHGGKMCVSQDRLERGCKIISDTFGFVIGETDKCKTPIAACGRVLAYPLEDRNSYELGDAVCSGPGGTVSKMTRKEIIMYPERIIGTVSEIPEYKTWGTGNVEVDGRIWIYVR